MCITAAEAALRVAAYWVPQANVVGTVMEWKGIEWSLQQYKYRQTEWGQNCEMRRHASCNKYMARVLVYLQCDACMQSV